MANIFPQGKQAYFTSAGTPLVGGKLYTWTAGTTTPQATYADAGQVTPNTNPVILDARGEALIYWSGSYKVQLQDSTGAVIWTVDNVSTVSDLSGLSVPNSASLINTTRTGTTTTRTLAAKLLAEMVSVLDFGADPTGLTDSTAAFQSAVNSASNVAVPYGTYLIAGSVTMPYGAKLWGVSTHGTIRPGAAQVTLGPGSIINVTSTSVSPFIYYSGNTFQGLTFYYPNQLRTLASPIIYPPTFAPNAAGASEVLTNNLWRDIGFVNSYRCINALTGHLDFEFSNIEGFPLYRGIETDGCGGTDFFRNIRLSYYYFCQGTDLAAVYAQANAQGISVGRSDAFHMDRVYCGNLNVGIRFFQGTVNSIVGAYGSICGLSLDGNNYGIYSETTHPLGVNIVDMICNSRTYDIEVAAGAPSSSTFQITGFNTWGTRATSIRCNYAGTIMKLGNGSIGGFSATGITVPAASCDITINDVKFNTSSAAPITTGAACNNLVVTECVFNAAPAFNSALGTNVIIKDNAGNISATLASAATISVLNIGDFIQLTGTTNVTTINGGWTGRAVTFFCPSGLTFPTGGNIYGNKTVAAQEAVTFVYDGATWHPTR